MPITYQNDFYLYNCPNGYDNFFEIRKLFINIFYITYLSLIYFVKYLLIIQQGPSDTKIIIKNG